MRKEQKLGFSADLRIDLILKKMKVLDDPATLFSILKEPRHAGLRQISQLLPDVRLLLASSRKDCRRRDSRVTIRTIHQSKISSLVPTR